jgi:hypothetical protein
LKITICVYNHAQVPLKSLTQALQEVTRIYHHAGVELAWLERPVSLELAQGAVDYVEQLGPTGLILRIVPRSMDKHLTIRDSVLGYASSCGKEEAGCMAHVLYHRVENLARNERASPLQVLGLAIAHELGHLLLGSNAHLASGIMAAKWGVKELELAAKGNLLFTAEQSQAMRKQILGRIKAHETLLERAASDWLNSTADGN